MNNASPAVPVYVVPDSELKKNGGQYYVEGRPAIPITGASADTISSGDAEAGQVLTADGNGGVSFEDAGGGGVTYPLLAPDGSNTAPSYSFASETGTGMYHAAGELYLVVQGVQRIILTGQRAIMGRLEASVGTASEPSHTFAADTDTGMYNGGNPNRLSFTLGGVESTRMEAGGASTTRFWLYDETNGGLKQVQVGAADSGGSGFRVLRVVN